MGVGLRATYLVADNLTWDTTGTIGGDAGRRARGTSRGPSRGTSP